MQRSFHEAINEIHFQLSKIYLDMLNVYKVTSENISNAVAEAGEEVLKQPLLKAMRAVKREILTLISTWIAKSHDTCVSAFCVFFFFDKEQVTGRQIA